MPLGSSSEAPAMSPGPSRRLRRDLVLAQLWPWARFFRLLGVAVTAIEVCLVGTSKNRSSADDETRPISLRPTAQQEQSSNVARNTKAEKTMGPGEVVAGAQQPRFSLGG